MPPVERRPKAEGETTSTLHRIGLIGVAVILITILVITLSPTPVDAGREDWVAATLQFLYRLGVPGSFGYQQLEFTANIVMFMPLGIFTAMALARGRYWIGILALPLLSILIELLQLQVLPGRTATLSDVIANSIGGILGFTLASLALRITTREKSS